VKPKTLFNLLWASYLALVVYWIFRFQGHFPAFMDTLEYVFPEKWFNVESFRNGRIPLWNPYLACGTPHLANFQSAFFYPFFWIWNLTGLTDWFFTLGLLHGVLAAVGFYLWLRSLDVSPIPATLCALSFGGSALLVVDWGFPTHLASLAWVPWVFWGTARLSREPSFQRWVWLSLFWAFQILAGYPFFTFYTVLFVGVFLHWKLKADPRMKLTQVGALVTALALTACQWLPFLDFLGYLRREGGGEGVFSLRWVNFLTLFSPDILGTPGTSSYRGDYPNFIFNNLYLGLVPLALFLWGFFSPLARESFWKKSALFWLFWLAVVHVAPLKVLARGLDRLEPSKASFLFLFCALTAVGLALQEKIQFTSRKNWVWKGAWALGFLWLVDILLVPARVIQRVPDPYRIPETRQAAVRAREWVGEGRLAALRGPEQNYSNRLEGAAGSFQRTAENLLPNTNVVWGLRAANGHLSIYTNGFQNLRRYLQAGRPYDGRVLDAAGVGLIVFPGTFGAFKYQSVGTMGGAILTRNSGAMGNAWVVQKLRELPGRPQVFEALLDPKLFLENEVYTEKGPDEKAVHLPPPGRALSGVSAPSLWEKTISILNSLFKGPPPARFSRPSPCEAGLQTVAPGRGNYLVFNESFTPGWRSWVNGNPKPIFRANGLWMTVPLEEAGVNKILFRYEPVAFRLGLFLTLLSVVGFFGVIARRFFFPR
jgi:hypothetical protein